MKLEQVIKYADEIKPNAFSNEIKTQWINECEGLVQTEVLLFASAETVVYDFAQCQDHELLAAAPHDKLYGSYLTAMIDFANGEYSKYQNTMQLFNSHFEEYMRWFASRYRPADVYDASPPSMGHYISAYGIAVKHGFEGSEKEWLDFIEANGRQAQEYAAQAEASAQDAAYYASEAGQKVGPQGPQGEKGDKGDTGEKGDAGAPGVQGAQGIQGIPGIKGEKGDTGAQGIQGIQGEKGDTGAQGIQGPQGEKGDRGEDGTGVTILGSYDSYVQLKSAHPDGTPGEAYLISGELYVWSQSQYDWINVGNIKGPKGDKGDTGAQGPQGALGPQGPKGDTGNDGYTPVRGADYWTAADKSELVSDTAAAIDLSGKLDRLPSATDGNFVAFDGAAGAQKDSGKKAADFATPQFVINEAEALHDAFLTGLFSKADLGALNMHTNDDAVHVGSNEKEKWYAKQDALKFDSTPTSGSTNPVTSGGVYTANNSKLDKSGGTMTGALNMNAKALTNLPTPVNTGDATPKTYVDSKVGSIASSTYSTTLTTTWNGSGPYTQTVTIPGMTPIKNGIVGLGITTAAQREAARNAMLSKTAQDTNIIIITADGDKPTVTIPIVVIMFG